MRSVLLCRDKQFARAWHLDALHDSADQAATKHASLSVKETSLIDSVSLEALQDVVPAGEELHEWPPVTEDAPRARDSVHEDMRPSSRHLLTHLKRRFTDQSDAIHSTDEILECPSPFRHLMNDAMNAFAGYPSPKRRRLSSMEPPQSVSMFSVMKGKSRLDASRWFYDLLLLKSHHSLDLEQSEPHGDILILNNRPT